MSFRPPSNQRQYDTYSSLDPAFIQAPPVPGENATDDEKRAAEDYLAKLKAAKQTGDWSPMLAPGKTLADATKFVLGQVDRNVWRAIMDRAGQLPPDSPRFIGFSTLQSLLFRLALKSVVGFGDVKVERLPDPQWDNWTMAQSSIVTMFDELNPLIVGEIGIGILNRLKGDDPLD